MGARGGSLWSEFSEVLKTQRITNADINTDSTFSIKMNIKKTSWHARLWQWSYVKGERSLPQNFCSYSRQVGLAMILFPIALPSRFLEGSYNAPTNMIERTFAGIISWVIVLMVYLLGYGVARDWFNQGGNWLLAYALPCGVLACAAFLLCVFLCVFVIMGLFYLRERLSDFFGRVNQTTPKTNQRKNILIEYIKAKKNKYCPKIDWE